SKAIAIGGHYVMLGNRLAATDESPGEKFTLAGKEYVVYKGMASVQNILKSEASKERYFVDATDTNIANIVPQGVEAPVLNQGPAVLYQLVGGLRIGMAHTGAESIYEMHQKAIMCQVLGAGMIEGGTHDLENLGPKT
ncbi:IMP dehydrogenase, partial [candidate division KSB1 bacterium]